MKKKVNIKIFLIVGVVLIWGYIAFKAISLLKNPLPLKTSNRNTISDASPVKSPDTFNLLLNYEDPFLKSTTSTYRKFTKNTSNKRPRKAAPFKSQKVNISWPQIVYKGIITNNNSDKVTIMLTINKRNHILYRGSEVEYIKVLQITKDSVKLNYKNDIKYYRRDHIK